MTVHDVRSRSGEVYFLESGEYNDILKRKNEANVYLYPERTYNTRFLATEFLPPAGVTIITENPWIISSYDRNKVFVLDEGKWVHPSFQTFGCSVEILMDRLLDLSTSIPRLPNTYLKQLLGK